MTQIHPIPPPREDEQDIAFKNTRPFAASKWTTTVDSLNLGTSERARALRQVASYESYGNFMTESIGKSSSPRQSTRLQSLQLLARPIGTFIYTFEQLIAPEQVDMSLIWGLIYLNVNLALGAEEKLRRVTQWLGDLKRAIDSLNQAVDNFQDKNSVRQEVTDVFEPMLQMLTDLIKFQHTWVTDVNFGNPVNTAVMRDAVDGYIAEIDKVVTHMRQTTQYSKASQLAQANLQVSGRLAFRDRKNPNDFCEFPVDNLPKILTDNFFGRQAQLEQIEKHLGAQDLQTLRVYTIFGRRGVGKTQIALQYARLFKQKFDAVFWVRSETSVSLRQSFAEIAVALELPGADKNKNFEENQIKVLQWLEKTDKTWLLIFDNAERGQLLKSYWPRKANGSVLLTSRSLFNFANEESRAGDNIPLFTSDERWYFLMQLLGDDWANSHLGGAGGQSEKKAAKALMDRLGGLALAISQAATLILDTKVTGDASIVTFLNQFEAQRQKLPPRQVGHRDNLIHALDTVWSIAFDALTPNARSLLGVFALLSPDSMPIDLFLPSNQNRLNGKLVFCRQTGSASAVAMSPMMQSAVDELLEARLIQRDDRNFVIHRVIQEATIGIYDDIDALQASFDATTQLLHEAFPIQLLGRPLHKEWPRCQTFVQHVVRLSKLFIEFRKGQDSFNPSLDFVRVLSNCGWYLYEVGDYGECLKMMETACSASEDKNTLLYSHLINTIGSAYFELNHLKKCRSNFESARDLREELLPENDLQVAVSLANLGNVETAEGSYDEAQVLLEEAARIREPQKEPLMLGLTFLQLGRVWFLRNEFDHARQMFSKADACFAKQGAEDPLYIANLNYAYGNLELERALTSRYVSSTEGYEQALRYYLQCKEACDAHAPFHQLASANFYKLACTEFAMEHPKKALAYLEKAFNIAEIRSGGEVDGTVARIWWKKSEILIEDDIRRDEGVKLRKEVTAAHENIVDALGLTFDADELYTDKAFDMLVPGYFR